MYEKGATFEWSIHLRTLWNHQFGAKYGPRGPPRAIYEPGGQGVAETPIVSKGLKLRKRRFNKYHLLC